MKILHAFSNWKWTGPAEPAVRLAAALAKHVDVDFACGSCPHDDLENKVETAAKSHGLPLLEGLRLRKHFDPWNSARDYRRIREVLAERRYTLVHAHLLNDHLLFGAAARRTRGSGAPPLVLRTVYGGPDLSPRIRTALAFSRLVDGVVCASEAAAEEVRRRTAVPPERLIVVPGAVDVDRFAAPRLAPLRDAARAELGCRRDAVVLGIVARVQRHRRFDLLFEAFARAARVRPELELVIIGRGTHIEEIAHRPVARLGISDRVRFPGYREGGAYDALLAALDVGIFLVPGSDASCRAARELAAAGLPLVVTRRPPLPEIVGGDACGIVVDEEPDALAAAFVALAEDASRRAHLASASRARAVERFSVAGQAQDVLGFYRRVLEMGAWVRSS